MLQVVLACYTEFEDRVGLMTERDFGSTAYDIVKRYTEEKTGSLPVRRLLPIVRVLGGHLHFLL